MRFKATCKLNTSFLIQTRASGFVGHLRRRLADRSPVGQQVSVQVSLAGVALGTVNAGVRTDAAVGQHVFLEVKLPP